MNYLWLVVGPSGTGKTTLVKTLTSDGIGVKEALSHTTRPIRPNERDGFDYYFVDRAHFEQGIETGQFLEYVEYNSNYYGVSKKEIDTKLEWGDCMIIVEGHGAKQLMDLYPNNSRMIFLVPPPIEELKRRMQERGDSKELIERRLASVKAECEFMDIAHYLMAPQDRYSLLRAVKSVVSLHHVTAVGL